MTYRSLLVHLGADARVRARTQAATDLAHRLQAHLVGLAPTGRMEVPAVVDPVGAVGELGALAWAAMCARAEALAGDFRSACGVAGLRSFEAVVDEEDVARSLVHHSHCSDLVILSQPDPAAHDHRAARAALEQVVLRSARPSLVLPYAGEFPSLGRHAMVAWDDSREAARALADALPMLRQADSVQVIAWNESSSESDPLLPERLDALQRWLMWQGVSAECRAEATEVPIDDAILSRLSDLGADLLVMGAYGHARWTERVLGGATRGLLASMTVPVLMSH
jgi:nucleotide-binding universal stress UspA family protein